MTLLAVPNVSEGRDAAAIEAIGEAFAAAGARLLDTHVDPDHDRSVFTLAGEPGAIAGALLAGAREVVARVQVPRPDGVHPHVGALDVAPVVYLHDADRGAACAEALVAGDLLGRELGLPVFLYGLLGGGRTRSELRRGGLAELARRMRDVGLAPELGPAQPHAGAGAA
ncbi:MAG: glutamate formiminotransferase / 5-formyltetrahydrofolate cyclo-ligase, partial [Solirubrobacteraceae bacterium]|nr:glutamate formiminotransferase / 5-formyltetrahydrofolate cyclo-ligase [Solirubrobacteraceae bacterium]